MAMEEMYLEVKLPKGTFREVPGHSVQLGPGQRQRSPTYQSWFNMVVRCYYPGAHTEHIYMDRGIRVCDRWISGGFSQFHRDMGSRPSGMTLDRIDPEGNYEPGNCRWSDASTQQRNKRNSPRHGASASTQQKNKRKVA